ncbi:hypothetical protein C2E21_6101 [Chlorella sorokiniana]|uniref:Uncharacterized protein n=1 Tax=Chlorella sorokiniana TaxID=3076 RepID=A0A2P6TLZ3_CHLSO|nr:hypothetical protein C2E21_6101 [Chlorella sorokiniana]|eukprot:PRW45353.1 hypothetical protein C2E21_6101 [Chlorella sorokiniana]
MSLLGTPNLPFWQRFNLTYSASLSVIIDTITMAVTAIYWARVGLAASPALQVFLAIHMLGCSVELAWRWQCGKASDGGSYARYRELPSLVMRVNDALLGPMVLWPRALLDRLPAADGSSAKAGTWAVASAATRHAALLLFGSATTGQALSWAKPLRLCLAVPIHLLMTVNMARRFPTVCAAACLSTPAAQQRTSAAFRLLGALRYDMVRPLGSEAQPKLSAQSECIVVLTYLELTLGCLLPALIQAAAETRLYVVHCAERRRAGLPRECGWQARVHDELAELAQELSWPQIAVLLWVVLGIAFDLSLLAAK